MKPASTSSMTIVRIRKKVEVAKAGASRNSTRQTMNRIIDSEWLMMAILRLVVDFKSSMNSTTRAPASNRSDRLTGQGDPEVMATVNSGSVNLPLAICELNPPCRVSATRLYTSTGRASSGNAANMGISLPQSG